MTAAIKPADSDSRTSPNIKRGVEVDTPNPNFTNTDYEGAAKLTVSFVDHGNTPDQLSETVLKELIVMGAESKINIWHRETGLSVASLTALYRLYETGAGYTHARAYANYEVTRKQLETP